MFEVQLGLQQIIADCANKICLNITELISVYFWWSCGKLA